MIEIIGLIVVGVLLYFLFRVSLKDGGMMSCGGHASGHKPDSQKGNLKNPNQETAIDTYRDPVCGMIIAKGTELGTINYNGKNFYFCSSDCKKRFEKNPQIYV